MDYSAVVGSFVFLGASPRPRACHNAPVPLIRTNALLPVAVVLRRAPGGPRGGCGGGRKTGRIEPLAVYLTAYALGVKPLLLLLAAVPAVKQLHVRL